MYGSIDEVQEKISTGTAKVYTAAEFKRMVREGSRPSLDGVDVVTCGTMGVMSGTMAAFSIPLAAPGQFKRAESIRINGVPGTVGPCPNESLGVVDCMVNGTSYRDRMYGGGHLFKDLASGKKVTVEALTDNGRFSRELTLSEIPFARMILTRGSYRNYSCFVNGTGSAVSTIFSGPAPIRGGYSQASFSGCGEINPVQNDPDLDYLRPGASVLLNGSPGMVTGTGTRSTAEHPNLSIEADMHGMHPEFMGGFITSAGPECMTSVAAAIPVNTEKALEKVSVLDCDIPLQVADLRDRRQICRDDYGSVWEPDDVGITAEMSECLGCGRCAAEEWCPTGADPSKGIDYTLCVSCGMCVSTCIGQIFSASLGSVDLNGERVPVVVRQSSRLKAERLCELLKMDVEAGKWSLRAFDAPR